jgi:hypothetical protein
MKIIELKIIKKFSFRVNFFHFRVFFTKIVSLIPHPIFKDVC